MLRNVFGDGERVRDARTIMTSNKRQMQSCIIEKSSGAAGIDDNPWTISEISAHYAITLRALRYYEKRGLLEPIRRGKDRLYDNKQMQRLQKIIKGKQLGFSLNEIGKWLESISGSINIESMAGLDNEQILSQLCYLKERQAEIKRAIAELERALKTREASLNVA
jgi:DNA-binding transcriptional MerR regulator